VDALNPLTLHIMGAFWTPRSATTKRQRRSERLSRLRRNLFAARLYLGRALEAFR